MIDGFVLTEIAPYWKFVVLLIMIECFVFTEIIKPHWKSGSHKQDAAPIIEERKYYKVGDCEMIGVPMPTFRWFKDNKLIEEDNNTLGIYFSDKHMR